MNVKICTKCEKKKPIREFVKHSRGKDGVSSWCKLCACQISKMYRNKYPERDKLSQRKSYLKHKKQRQKDANIYHQKNKKKRNDYCKKWRIKNKETISIKRKEVHKKTPWKQVLISIKQRCNNPKNKNYHRYGGRGIKCLITEKEVMYLWNLCKAFNMKTPTIDRINNDGDYTWDNCQFLEKSKNSGKDKNKTILQFSLDGKFIKVWESATIINKELGFSHSYIDACARGLYKQADGYIWKFKEIN